MLSWLFGLDPTGVEAIVLCVLTCSALIALMFTGFALSSRYLGTETKLPHRAAHHPDELGLLALWRLDREQRTNRASDQLADPMAEEVGRR